MKTENPLIEYGDLLLLNSQPNCIFYALDVAASDGRVPVTLTYINDKNGIYLKPSYNLTKNMAACFERLHESIEDSNEIQFDTRIPILRLPKDQLSKLPEKRCEHSFDKITASMQLVCQSLDCKNFEIKGSHQINACGPESDVDMIVRMSNSFPPPNIWIDRLLESGFTQTSIERSSSMEKTLADDVLATDKEILNSRNAYKFLNDDRTVDIHLTRSQPSWFHGKVNQAELMSINGVIKSGTPHTKPSIFIIRSEEEGQSNHIEVISYLHATSTLRVGDNVTLTGKKINVEFGMSYLVMCDLDKHLIKDIQFLHEQRNM